MRTAISLSYDIKSCVGSLRTSACKIYSNGLFIPLFKNMKNLVQRGTGIASIAILSLSSAPANSQVTSAGFDAIQGNVETLNRGLLSVRVIDNPSIPCNGNESFALAADAAAALLAPLFESAVDAAGQYILNQSGKGKETLAIQGLATSHFYCIPPKATGKSEEPYKYYLNPLELLVSSPANSLSGDKPGFQLRLRFVPSKDGSAYKLVPIESRYVSPIMNRRAFGVILQIGLQGIGESSSNSVVLPLGFTSCGRVNNICSEKDNVQELASASSQWIPILDLPNLPVAKLQSSRSSSLYKPFTVTAKLVEISTYDKFLAFVGNFLMVNKSKVSDVLIASLPPITSSDRSKAIKTTATSSINSLVYGVAKRNYFTSVAENKSCTDQITAWKAAINAAVDANINSELVDQPPRCAGRP